MLFQTCAASICTCADCKLTDDGEKKQQNGVRRRRFLMNRNRMITAFIICMMLILVPMEVEAEGNLTIESVVIDRDEIYVGDTVRWTVNASGGKAPYTYDYSLRQKVIYRNISFAETGSEITTDSNVYEYTLDGWCVSYRFYVTVTDAAGKKVSYQSDDYMLRGGMADKMKEIIEECAYEGLSDYEKAYNLYDWLCVNAEYDQTYTWHSPEGVLRYGTGVCDSFATAYKALLDQAGVECEYVHGIADYNPSEGHVWVMVKLDGEWYHMDPTWDEGHDFKCYFGLNTEFIERDHTSEYIYDWKTLQENYDIPFTDATKYNYALNHADGLVSDMSEVNAVVDSMHHRKGVMNFYCIGAIDYAEVRNWFYDNKAEYRLNGYNTRGTNPVAAFTLTRPVEITVPVNMVKIEDGAFEGDTSITGVYIPGQQVVSIGSRAFADCSALTAINLPESITYIADDAFEGCSPDLVVTCAKGSYAKTWCSYHGVSYRYE